MAASVVNLLKRTASLAGATLASRVLGFVREILMAQILGGGAAASAWSFAFKIPNLCRRVFGEGLLGPVLVPLISQSLEKEGKDYAARRFSTIFMWMTLFLCTISIVVSAGSLVVLQFAEQEQMVLTCQLIPLVMPYCIFICLVKRTENPIRSSSSTVSW